MSLLMVTISLLKFSLSSLSVLIIGVLKSVSGTSLAFISFSCLFFFPWRFFLVLLFGHVSLFPHSGCFSVFISVY